jgi:hypothetical protein
MLTQQENDRLTQTGRGTPCGELLRCYWQPVALSEELPPGRWTKVEAETKPQGKADG